MKIISMKMKKMTMTFSKNTMRTIYFTKTLWRVLKMLVTLASVALLIFLRLISMKRVNLIRRKTCMKMTS
jgi:hypothetical protein